jgi:hypothetical protein
MTLGKSEFCLITRRHIVTTLLTTGVAATMPGLLTGAARAAPKKGGVLWVGRRLSCRSRPWCSPRIKGESLIMRKTLAF